jgi:hypothetical protein
MQCAQAATLLRAAVVFAAACVCLPGARAAGADAAIERGAAAFYRVYLELRPSGVPAARARGRLAPAISPSLAELLQRADAAERHYKKVTRNEVPPLVEGDLFTSLFEGAHSFVIRECHRSVAGGAVCSVELQHAGTADKTTIRWSDKIYLVRHAGRWVVDDIEYLGDWQFMHKGRLRELLRRVIRDGANARP